MSRDISIFLDDNYDSDGNDSYVSLDESIDIQKSDDEDNQSDENGSDDDEHSDDEKSENGSDDENSSDEEDNQSDNQSEDNSDEEDNQSDEHLDENNFGSTGQVLDTRKVLGGVDIDEDMDPDVNKNCLNNIQKALVSNSQESLFLYALLSSITAAVGFATNSQATIIGSMLLSPVSEIIFRIAILGNFKLQKYNDMTNKDLGMEAYQKEYFEMNDIPFYYFRIDDNKRIVLKKKPDMRIKSINIRNKNVFLLMDDGKYYNLLGEEIEIRNVNFIKNVSIEDFIEGMHKYQKQEFFIKNIFIGDKYKLSNVIGLGLLICLFIVLFGFIIMMILFAYKKKEREEIQKYEVKIKEKTMTKEDKRRYKFLKENPMFQEPTELMKKGINSENAIGMIFIAICAGIIIPDALRYNSSIKLVGIGIATALLPPLVNLGMYLALYTLKNTTENEINVDDTILLDAIFTAAIIFSINFILMTFISGYKMYKMCSNE